MTIQPDASAIYTGTFDTTEVGGSRETDMQSVSPVWTPTVEVHPEGVADVETLLETTYPILRKGTKTRRGSKTE